MHAAQRRESGRAGGLPLRGFLAGFIAAGLACARTPAPGPQDVRRVGRMTVCREGGWAETGGVVCLDGGVLDYLLVGPESGKEYESLIVLDASPSEVHAALLALGAQAGSIAPEFKGDRRGDPLDAEGRPVDDPRPGGARVRISVRREGGPAEWLGCEAWLRDRRTGRPPERLEWVFTGSYFARRPTGGERYMGDAYQTVAALWYDGVAPLNLAAAAGSPYRGEALGFEIHSDAAPPVNARVRVRFVLEREP